MSGLIKYGNVFFNQITPRAKEGTIISNLGEFDACKIDFATVLELKNNEELFDIFSKDG